MKKIIISTTFAFLVSFANSANRTNTDSSKTAFYSAFDALKNMLEYTDSLNYEKAVFITENAYYNNTFDYGQFKLILDLNTKIISSLAENAKEQYRDKYKTMKLYEQRNFNLNAANWAIFKYLTDTIIIKDLFFGHYKYPFNYSTDDPYGSTQWENTQVIHLLKKDNGKGNCYALSTLFKIFSDRLKSDAQLAVAPHHIYIQNRNQRGDFKNVELTTKTFPGDGSIQTLTYTTHELIMNGMSQRALSNRDAVALNLIYLAKGFEHKFNDNTNDFLLKCADLAFKHDSLSLNALLLKTEVTENRLFAAMKKNKITTVAQARTNPQTQKLLAAYEKQLNHFYKIGYREIPKDIEHILLSAMQGNKDGYIATDKTPNPFAAIGKKQRYATLSWGVFDEVHADVDTIQYFHASLNTKKKKIIEFLPIDTSNTYKVDPVVFAMNVDPLASKFPYLSPYCGFNDNPIYYVDPDGAAVIPADTKAKEAVGTQLTNVLGAFAGSIQYAAMGTYTDQNNKEIAVSGFQFIPTTAIPTLGSLITKIKKSNMTDDQKAKAVAYAGVAGGVDAIVISSIEPGATSLGIGEPIVDNNGADAEIGLGASGDPKINEKKLTGDDFMPYPNGSKVQINNGSGLSVKPVITMGFSTNSTSPETLDAIIGTYNTTEGVQTRSFTNPEGVKKTLGANGTVE